MSKKKPKSGKPIDQMMDDFNLYKRIKCPKCGTQSWSALKKEVVNGWLRTVSCDLCPSKMEHH